ncbi:hypothetical protein IWQ60_000267 [Tieghemiomyces parasiticus]|uniref:Microsomal glutathione S-transferase 3 n=1 Tax=Tieghemiomyces parasiticus TaxID=78921 RepID=A0A9W8E3L6_9FUNG|nr:hypothetical protein IWQ60_000267 [Tieghemiomyces parasiticus]
MPTVLTIDPNFGWSVLAALAMGVQCFVAGGTVAAARKKYNVPHPDCGAGRHASKLSDEDWKKFNVIQRCHLNYVEMLSLAQSSVLLAGLFFPRVAGALGLSYIFGRFLYARGYVGSNPQARAPGFMIALISNVGMIGAAGYGALQLLGYL